MRIGTVVSYELGASCMRFGSVVNFLLSARQFRGPKTEILMSPPPVSKEAKKFLTDHLDREAGELPDISNICRLRKSIKESYRPQFERVLRRESSSTEDVCYGDVTCFRVIPKENDQVRTDCVLFYLFGGGYITGSPEEDLTISAVLGNSLRVDVVCPRYRLAPDAPFPMALDDSLSAYRCLIDQYEKVVVVGESAGGHLALQTILGAFKEKLPLPQACALLSPWADISLRADSLSFNDGRDPTLTREWLERASSLFAPGLDHQSSSVSPLFADYPERFPPTFISTGTRDLLMSISIELNAKLRQAKIQTELSIVEDMWHVFEFYPDLPESAASLRRISQFISRYL